MIDVGCGEGLFATKLAATNPRLNVIGIDPDDGRLRLCLQRCRDLDLSNIAVTRGTGAAMPSLTLTVKLLAPTSLLRGVPDSVPLAATDNHAGPLTLANARVLPTSISLASPASVPL